MKKISSLLLVLVLVLSLAAPAFADEAITPVTPDLSEHTYTAYQIFTGTQAADNSKLAVTDWGTGVDGAALLTALQADSDFVVDGTNAFAACTTAREVAEVLSAHPEFAQDFAEAVEPHITTGTPVVNGQTELPAGYYLVVDTTEDTSGEYEVVNLSLLQLTQEKEFEIAVKVDVPELQKKVDDKNDSTTAEDNVDWNDSADYDIDDNVPFQLTATMPTDLAYYSTYKLIFHDAQSKGLTFNDDAKVYVVNGDTKTEVNTGKYTVSTTPADGHTFDVIITDVLSLTDTDGNAITVNKDSKIVVEYTSLLNEDAEVGYIGNPNTVYLEYSNNPNYGGENETGKTPIDKVIVFTYKLAVEKVDENLQPLTGAIFTLYKWDASVEAEDKWVEVATVDGTALTTFVFNGLDDGKYKLVETKAPAGYNMALDVEFEITAEHDLTAADPKLISLTINNESVTAEQAGEEGSKYYTGTVNTTVINQSGATLPETGGMGTTLFYIVGGILVLAAVVLLVTKRRMNTAE